MSLNVQTAGAPNLHNRDQVAVLSNIAPQTSNILYVQFTGEFGGIGYLNALQIESVPEPGSACVLGTGGVLMLGFRRKNVRHTG